MLEKSVQSIEKSLLNTLYIMLAYVLVLHFYLFSTYLLLEVAHIDAHVHLLMAFD